MYVMCSQSHPFVATVTTFFYTTISVYHISYLFNSIICYNIRICYALTLFHWCKYSTQISPVERPEQLAQITLHIGTAHPCDSVKASMIASSLLSKVNTLWIEFLHLAEILQSHSMPRQFCPCLASLDNFFFQPVYRNLVEICFCKIDVIISICMELTKSLRLMQGCSQSLPASSSLNTYCFFLFVYLLDCVFWCLLVCQSILAPM